MARWTGGEASMKAEDDFLDLADKIGTKEIEERLDASIVQTQSSKKMFHRRDFEFRPLTEEEKKEFVNSLNADGKRILAQLAGNVTRSGESAA